MKLLYLECGMGASGDMLLGALAGLLDDPHAFVREMNALGLPGVRVEMEPSVKCGITGASSQALRALATVSAWTPDVGPWKPPGACPGPWKPPWAAMAGKARARTITQESSRRMGYLLLAA